MTTKKLLFSASGISALLVLCYAVMQALPSAPTNIICGMDGFDCRAVLENTAIPPTLFQTNNALGKFNIVESNDRGTTLSPAQFTGISEGSELGKLVWEFDTRPERLKETPVSTIARNRDDPDGWGRGDLYFHIIGSVEALGNIVYQSREPFHIVDDNVDGFYPLKNGEFTLTEDVEFVRADDPDGEVAFTISDLTLNINGSDS